MNSRKIELDCLRIVACGGVIVSHLACLVVFDTQYAQWEIANMIYVFRNACVPLFFVISGVVYLDREKDISYSKIIKSIKKLLGLYIVTAVMFQIMDISNSQPFLKILYDALVQPKSHLWYIPSIIGIYLLLPIIKKIIIERKVLEYYLKIWFIFSIGKELIFQILVIIGKVFDVEVGGIQGIIERFSIPELYTYSGYFILGYYLYYEFKRKIKIRYLSVLLLLSILLPSIINSVFVRLFDITLKNVWDYFSLGALLETCCITLLFKDYVSKIRFNAFFSRWILALSSCTLGIYFIHPIFTERFFFIMIKGNLIFTIFALSILIFFICSIIVAVIKIIWKGFQMIKLKENRYSELLNVIGIFILGVILHFYFADFSKAIDIYPDELRYYGIARSFYNDTGFSIRGVATDFQKIAYSFVIAPFFAIKNVVLRMRILSFTNSFIMMLSIFPVWLISKELKIDKRNRYCILLFTVLWPDMMFSMTFMSEILYWPLFLLFIYLWLVNEKRQKILYGIIEGILCYIGYLCKEIFLVVFLTCIAYEICYPIVSYFITREGKETKIKDYFSKRKLFLLFLFVFIFFFCHFIFKVFIFSGLGNSYNVMGISAILDPYKFLYLIYGFIYYIAALLVTLFILPFLYPIIRYRTISEQSRRLFCFISIFLLGAAATIAYTITVREDLGRIIPRVHLRYVGPAFIIILLLFFESIQKQYNEIDKNRKRMTWLFVSSVLIFACIVFKGAISWGLVDQFSLKWYVFLQDQIGVLVPPAGENFIIYTYIIVINVLMIIFVSSMHYICLYRSNIQMKNVFVVVIFIVCMINNFLAGKHIYSIMCVDKTVVDEIIVMNEYFEEKDACNILYLTDGNTINKLCKYMDTYFEQAECLYTIDHSFVLSMETEKVGNISETVLREHIFDGIYENVEQIDYFIVENAIDFGYKRLANVKYLPEISGNYYTVYQNLDPSTILVTLVENLCFSENRLEVIGDVIEESNDKRKVALQLQKMTIHTVE